jgi:hypothetical protein
MKAYVSGSAGVAAIVEDGFDVDMGGSADIVGRTATLIQIDALDTPRRLDLLKVGRFFADAVDVECIDVTDAKQLAIVLEHHWARDRSLRLLEMLLASENASEVEEIVPSLERLLRRRPIRNHVFSVAFLVPNPAVTAFRYRQQVVAERWTSLVLHVLKHNSEAIALARDALDRVPFKDKLQKAQFERDVIRAGIAPYVVSGRSYVLHPDMKWSDFSADMRPLLQAWLEKTSHSIKRNRPSMAQQVEHEEAVADVLWVAAG